MNLFKSIYIIFLLIIIPISVFTQEKERNEINQLLEASNAYMFKDDLKSLKYAQQATLLAEKIEDPSLTATSYLILARSLNYMGAYDQSLKYLSKGIKLPNVQKDILLKCQFLEFKADNFNNLGLFDQELKEYFDILNSIPSKKNREFEQLSSRIKARIAYNYYKQNDYESASIYIDRALKTQEELSKKERTSELYNIYQVKGEICLYSNKKDSAYYYFDKAYSLIRKGVEYEFISLKSFGDYYKEVGDWETAINFYAKALKDMEVFQVRDLEYTSEITKNLSELYKITGNEIQHKEYLEKHKKSINEVQESKRKNIQTAINLILEEQSSHQNKAISRLQIIIAISFLIIILLFSLQKRMKKRKQRMLKENEKIVHEKDRHLKVLKQKLQISLEEVIDEAKKNGPSFPEKFQVHYPEFSSKLFLAYPDLNSGEFTLLAYIYLNFSSKEIAAYTFRSYRTIQTRKYALRKKLGLESSDDFYVWLRNFS